MSIDALVRELGSLWLERRERAVIALVEIGEPAVPALIRAAGCRWWFAPAGAIEALGQIGDSRATLVVRRALRSWRPKMCRAAIIATGSLHDREAIPILGALCSRNPSYSGRDIVADALAEIGDPNAFPILLRLFRDGNPKERKAAQRAVQRIGRLAPDRLASHLGSGDYASLAAGALSDLEEHALPGLEAVIQAGREPAAARALALLASMGNAQPEHRAVLLSLLDDPDPTFRTAAATGLAHLSTQSADPHLRAAIRSLRKKDAFGASPLERRFYRNAITVIEQATSHLQQLPVPADGLGERTATLPRPAAVEATDVELRPLPSEDRSR